MPLALLQYLPLTYPGEPMVLYECLIAHGIWVSGVLTECFTQDDEAPGVFHLGLDRFEVGMLGDLILVKGRKLS